MALDLRMTEVGMNCEEYSLLIMAGLGDIPPEVRTKMDEHVFTCWYHQSLGFHQSALGTPVTEALEEAARKIVEKYSRVS